MCDRHAFHFDVDKAFADQLVSVLEASPNIRSPRLRRRDSMVSMFFFRKKFASVCQQLQELRSRLRDHLKKIENRGGISPAEVSCRFLAIDRMWEVARAEDALISHYKPK